jgi:site-specific recombinase XerD
MTDLELSGRVLPALPDGPDDLLRRLTAAWLKRYDSPHTRAAYKRDLKAWLGWCQSAGIHPLKARMMDVDGWLAHQRDEQQAARRSIARRLSAVASWYSYLIRNTASDGTPLITYNPAVTDVRPKVDRDASPTIGLSRAEADRLIAAADADGLRSSAVIRLLLTNAYRCGLITTATIGQLGWDRGHRVITIPVKSGTLRRDPIPPPTARALDAYLASRGDPETGPLFATATGRPVAEPYLFRLIRRLAAKAGIPSADQLSPHSLRHTAITEALDATHDLRKAQDLAGHADPRTTRLYDLRRGQLDGHAAYVLATRYGTGANDDASSA